MANLQAFQYLCMCVTFKVGFVIWSGWINICSNKYILITLLHVFYLVNLISESEVIERYREMQRYQFQNIFTALDLTGLEI